MATTICLEELVLKVLINVVQKLKDRTESFADPQIKSVEDEIAF
ncbi:MAG: hypothetical protein R6U27_03345 [Desulfobacterales bacterium]